MNNQPAPSKFLRWFDPRHRQISTWGFILNRVTAIGLTVYLALHLIMLGNLVAGPEAYDNFIALAQTPLIKFGEMFVIAGGLIHGLNGIRIALNSFGVAVPYQRQLLVGLMGLAGLGIVYFAYRMFLGA